MGTHGMGTHGMGIRHVEQHRYGTGTAVAFCAYASKSGLNLSTSRRRDFTPGDLFMQALKLPKEASYCTSSNARSHACPPHVWAEGGVDDSLHT